MIAFSICDSFHEISGKEEVERRCVNQFYSALHLLYLIRASVPSPLRSFLLQRSSINCALHIVVYTILYQIKTTIKYPICVYTIPIPVYLI